jgi:hypothetical protein
MAKAIFLWDDDTQPRLGKGEMFSVPRRSKEYEWNARHHNKTEMKYNKKPTAVGWSVGELCAMDISQSNSELYVPFTKF